MATLVERWFTRDDSEFVALSTIVRFLGRTPNTSNVTLALHSVCQQICYNLEIPMESIPEDFVPLKNFFNSLIEKAVKKKHKIIILLGGYKRIVWKVLYTLVFAPLCIYRCSGHILRKLLSERRYVVDTQGAAGQCQGRRLFDERWFRVL